MHVLSLDDTACVFAEICHCCVQKTYAKISTNLLFSGLSIVLGPPLYPQNIPGQRCTALSPICVFSKVITDAEITRSNLRVTYGVCDSDDCEDSESLELRGLQTLDTPNFCGVETLGYFRIQVIGGARLLFPRLRLSSTCHTSEHLRERDWEDSL